MGYKKYIYGFLKKSAEFFGYRLTLLRTSKQPRGYEWMCPLASYAPWLLNTSFNQVYNKIEKNTLVEKTRCYELWQLVEETANLSGALLEVGVWRGGTGTLIAKKAMVEGIKDRVYLCDTFEGVVKTGPKDSVYRGGEHSDTSKEIVTKLAKKLKLKNTTILKGVFPDETGSKIKETKFRFCHLDVDVYESTKDIFKWVWPKLVVGGIIVFDDYGFNGSNGVTNFVNQQRKKKDRVVIHNLNGHGIIIKLS